MAQALSDDNRIEGVNIENSDTKSDSRVRLTQILHPETLFTHNGIGAAHYIRVTDFLRTAPKEGFNPDHVSHFRFTDLTGGMPSQDFVVSIGRAQK